MLLHDLLRLFDPSPVVELGRLVVYAEVAGADTALAAFDHLDPAVPQARVAAVRAHLLK